MRYFYIAVQIEESGKNYAYTVKVSESDNLLCKLVIKGITAANIAPTKKQAAAIVEAWNAACKANNTYLFDSPNF